MKFTVTRANRFFFIDKKPADYSVALYFSGTSTDIPVEKRHIQE
jgi:hypothetical protein